MIKTQFSKFIVIGLFSTAINYALFYFLLQTFPDHHLLASASGFIAGVFAGYNLNKAWTFGVKDNSDRFVFNYFFVYLVSLCLGLILLEFLVRIAQVPATFANLLTIGLTTVTNFAGIKWWVFKK